MKSWLKIGLIVIFLLMLISNYLLVTRKIAAEDFPVSMQLTAAFFGFGAFWLQKKSASTSWFGKDMLPGASPNVALSRGMAVASLIVSIFFSGMPVLMFLL